jgi:tmRNA-binding protein
MQSKPREVPDQPDATLFGLNDMSTEQLQERRLQAMEIVRQQKELIEQRQRQQLLKQIQEQEYELKALDIMKEEYVNCSICLLD